MWLHTEANPTNAYDGVNLKISADGGMTYTIVDGVAPPYGALPIDMQPAWSGNQSPYGWQLYQADLSQYIGKVIRLRFSFRSDSNGVFPGAYIDDIFIN
jgi:bacillopeptidase F (M6 metalloprotease family)